MAHEPVHAKLPAMIVSPADVGRISRELAAIDDTMLSLKLRHEGESSVDLPKLSSLMDQLVSYNGLNLLHQNHRQALADLLDKIKNEAPVVHMSFSADPSANFLERLIVWLRQEIHPYLLVRVGLQPNIGAGCILRTNNHYFDLSIKQSFAESRHLLIEKLVDEIGPAAPAPSPAAVATDPGVTA